MSVNHQRLGTNRYHLPRSVIIAPPLKPRSFASSDVQPLLSTPMVGSRTSLIPAVLDDDTLDSLVPPLTPLAPSQPEHGSKPEHRMRRDTQRLRLRHSHSPYSIDGKGQASDDRHDQRANCPEVQPPVDGLMALPPPCHVGMCSDSDGIVKSRPVFPSVWLAGLFMSARDAISFLFGPGSTVRTGWYQRARVVFWS